MVRHRLSVCGIALGAVLALAWFGSAAAEDKIVGVSTLDWLPYTGSELPKGGATTEVVRTAFEQAGYGINVTYRPWKRAIAVAGMRRVMKRLGGAQYSLNYHDRFRRDQRRQSIRQRFVDYHPNRWRHVSAIWEIKERGREIPDPSPDRITNIFKT